MQKLDKRGIGERIRLLRQAGKLRLWQLAERIGAPQPAMHMYERGVVPEPARLLELARVGGTTVEWILTGRHAEDGSEEMRRPARQLLELARRLERYSEEDLQALLSSIETIDEAVQALRPSGDRGVGDLPVEELARRLREFEGQSRAALVSALEVHDAVARRSGRRPRRPVREKSA